ncbi:unnamed protein product [Hyaloperonospora brassicae]|uniref:Nep1-like protein n=1 Tax=Hyaloperonospora brassicae TaxID=162125 RepID=A0AAV0SX85_HYABA|nr:unnamed protein product [Hyaloperonospora brassicae]
MKICVALYGALLAATAVLAQGEPWKKKSISLELVEPFPEQKATTIGDKAGVKFKPQIHVSKGCSSYPAVNAAGETTDGMILDKPVDGKCKEPKQGSQAYGRGTWHLKKFAIMFAWHFPTYVSLDVRYDWEHVILWLNNPAIANPTIEAVSVWHERKREYVKTATPDSKYMDGSSLKLDLGETYSTRNLSLSTLPGQFQPLIMWDQMPDITRRALNETKWYVNLMPLSDPRFTTALDNAWPYTPV